ncbi:MAG: 4-alpha-glucanotransferase, partial [Acidimicrobiales bacterium]
MRDGRAWGVQHGYHDDRRTWHDVAPETVDALLDAMGAGDRPPAPMSAPPGEDCPVLVVDSGEQAEVPGRWLLRTEDGGEASVEGSLPADVPLGYHRLVREDDGFVSRLVVAPPACHLPDGLHIWGWAVQLYAARSRASWGMGDLGDLARIGRWSAG